MCISLEGCLTPDEFHVTEFAASFADLLNHRALVFRRHLDRQLFKRFGDGIAVPMQDDFGLRDL